MAAHIGALLATFGIEHVHALCNGLQRGPAVVWRGGAPEPLPPARPQMPVLPIVNIVVALATLFFDLERVLRKLRQQTIKLAYPVRLLIELFVLVFNEDAIDKVLELVPSFTMHIDLTDGLLQVLGRVSAYLQLGLRLLVSAQQLERLVPVLLPFQRRHHEAFGAGPARFETVGRARLELHLAFLDDGAATH